MNIRKFTATILSAALFLAPYVYASAEDTTAPQSEEAAQTSVIFDSDTKKLECNGCVIISDYQNAPTALLVMTYTNKTADANSPIFDCFQTVFQGGVSLNTTVISDPNYVTYVNSQMTQVKDGASVTYAVPYLLNDTYTSLEVEFKDAIYNGNSFTLNISLPADAGGNAESEPASEVDWQTKYSELLEQYKILEEKYNALVSQTEGN